MTCGTLGAVPNAKGEGIRPATEMEIEIRDPRMKRSIVHRHSVQALEVVAGWPPLRLLRQSKRTSLPCARIAGKKLSHEAVVSAALEGASKAAAEHVFTHPYVNAALAAARHADAAQRAVRVAVRFIAHRSIT
ncbi:MAG: hypothetical protein ACRYGA_13785 [Janthinobacterium lividum]